MYYMELLFHLCTLLLDLFLWAVSNEKRKELSPQEKAASRRNIIIALIVIPAFLLGLFIYVYINLP